MMTSAVSVTPTHFTRNWCFIEALVVISQLFLCKLNSSFQTKAMGLHKTLLNNNDFSTFHFRKTGINWHLTQVKQEQGINFIQCNRKSVAGFHIIHTQNLVEQNLFSIRFQYDVLLRSFPKRIWSIIRFALVGDTILEYLT
ncbi:Hypothetical predicted protein [Pelobates cultripes]|uniref:Uncharacterized protein n=1 Tax=Pelobates cultripes TaxID=61616 RepID=A0AAD1W7S8_PELCU|nr:Hypothetical predicted protein [Pelobates cultripes]